MCCRWYPEALLWWQQQTDATTQLNTHFVANYVALCQITTMRLINDRAGIGMGDGRYSYQERKSEGAALLLQINL
jgi:hypothetical protein